jgi:hypothetical protein
MREREIAMKDSNASSSVEKLTGSRPRGAKTTSSGQRKQATADRIGIGRPR